MIITVVSSAIASDLVVGIAIVASIAFAIISELTDVSQKPPLALLSRYFAVFMVPLLILFAYIVIMWVARILTG